MAEQRTITMPKGNWADGAETTIPFPPETGTAYRNPNVNLSEWRAGHPFEAIVDSSKWNQLFYLLTAMVSAIEKNGILAWSQNTDYLVDAVAMGTNGILYQAKLASGPSGGSAREPSANPTYWNPLNVHNVLVERNASDAHPIQAITDLETTLNSIFSVATTAVQTATLGGIAVPKDGTTLNFPAYPSPPTPPLAYGTMGGRLIYYRNTTGSAETITLVQMMPELTSASSCDIEIEVKGAGGAGGKGVVLTGRGSGGGGAEGQTVVARVTVEPNTPIRIDVGAGGNGSLAPGTGHAPSGNSTSVTVTGVQTITALGGQGGYSARDGLAMGGGYLSGLEIGLALIRIPGECGHSGSYSPDTIGADPGGKGGGRWGGLGGYFSSEASKNGKDAYGPGCGGGGGREVGTPGSGSAGMVIIRLLSWR